MRKHRGQFVAKRDAVFPAVTGNSPVGDWVKRGKQRKHALQLPVLFLTGAMNKAPFATAGYARIP
jgi:hypothetical protein